MLSARAGGPHRESCRSSWRPPYAPEGGVCPGSCVLNSAHPRGCWRAHGTLGLSNSPRLLGFTAERFIVHLQACCGAIQYVPHFLSYGQVPTLRPLSSFVQTFPGKEDLLDSHNGYSAGGGFCQCSCDYILFTTFLGGP